VEAGKPLHHHCQTTDTTRQGFNRVPTDTADEEEKEAFYSQLQDTLDDIPTYDVKLLIGDFNAQISSDRRGLNSVVGP